MQSLDLDSQDLGDQWHPSMSVRHPPRAPSLQEGTGRAEVPPASVDPCMASSLIEIKNNKGFLVQTNPTQKDMG